MFISRKRQYLTIALNQPLAWLRKCAKNPSKHMSPTHVKLIKLAVRKIGGDY